MTMMKPVLDRRTLLQGGLSLAAATALARTFAPALASAKPKLGAPTAFTSEGLRAYAQNLATQPFQLPKLELAKALEGITYDQYRDIRYRKSEALWKSEAAPFEVELFHAGFYFKFPVEVNVVENGQSQPLLYSPDLFDFGPLLDKPASDSNTGFAGFRIHTPINKPDVKDEFVVFQGASYLRGIGKNHTYGLSARGLAIDTGQPKGEEFPVFRAFWLETPQPDAKTVTVHALLDSQSVTGAYTYILDPGDATVMDVESTVYPRRDLDHVGIAPLTSMFWYGPGDRRYVDDFRPAVHDSEGLSVWNGMGEWLWRPLINAETIQYTGLVDKDPKGFGLLQRTRAFHAFEDLEARYENRPSLWVEPKGKWGEGTVELLELPTKEEIHDNIVAFWRPKEPLKAGKGYSYSYRLHWCTDAPLRSKTARVTKVLVGQHPEPSINDRRYVIDFEHPEQIASAQTVQTHEAFKVEAKASAGEVKNVVLRPNPKTGGLRLSLEFDPGGNTVADLRAVLMKNGQQVSEIWMYRWTR